MTFKTAVYASTLAAGVGLAGLFGAGLGTASADPGPQCNAPNRPACSQDQQGNYRGPGDNQQHGDNHQQGADNRQGDNYRPGDDYRPGDNNQPGGVDWHNRDVGQARGDHQPFNWNGQEVYPIPAGDGNGFGFWFFGIWIPL